MKQHRRVPRRRLAQTRAAVQPVVLPPAAATPCLDHKHIDQWTTLEQLTAYGFFADIVGDQASLTFGCEGNQHYLALRVASDPASQQYTASRITELASKVPMADRRKCWQPTATSAILVEFVVRFKQATAHPGMLENLMLWNAPLPAKGSLEPAKLLTSAGVSRVGGSYIGAITQDLDVTTFQGFIRTALVPAWIDATAWHGVRTRVSQTRALVEVAQAENSYTTVIDVTLPHPPEPMAFEFSLDNETLPGRFSPVMIPDGLDVALLDIQLVP